MVKQRNENLAYIAIEFLNKLWIEEAYLTGPFNPCKGALARNASNWHDYHLTPSIANKK